VLADGLCREDFTQYSDFTRLLELTRQFHRRPQVIPGFQIPGIG
jgi:hypothetical protein